MQYLHLASKEIKTSVAKENKFKSIRKCKQAFIILRVSEEELIECCLFVPVLLEYTLMYLFMNLII